MLLKAEFINFMNDMINYIKKVASSEEGSSAIFIILIIILTAHIIYMINEENDYHRY